MNVSRRLVLKTIPLAALLGSLAACGASTSTTTLASSRALEPTDASLALDTAAWSYDSQGGVYYQMGLAYGSSIQDTAYETLSVFVPGAYVTAEDNGDGTYTLTPAEGSVGACTSANAPIVIPVNTPGYCAQSPLSEYSYSTVKAYMEAGLIYVVAGLRGKDSTSEDAAGNAPWGVTDLKAAVRYLRYNASRLPGDTEQVYVFGHSGGGAQSAVMGASGDSALYTPYLAAIGAATTDEDGSPLSDAVAGAMCWCPITSLNEANAAYEWNMGQFASSGTRATGTWTEACSKDLAAAYAQWVNSAGLTDADGNALTLERSREGVFLAGTYYEHLMGVIEGSLNGFLAVTSFPYTPSSTTMAGMELGGAPSGSAPSGGAPSKDVGALDGVDRGQTENTVLGVGSTTLHFSQVSRDVIAAGEASYASLSGWCDDYGSAGYDSDLAETDSLGTTVLTREQMYNPMYFLLAGSEGANSSTVAPSWRIRSGIGQGDTATTVEMNLALALESAGHEVDFATVWGQGHTMAELEGDAESNFISWVQQAAAR
ncbi:esterase [Actinomyces sp. W5033]|uniref:esterase n=1 Tax=Actinomyces sp. W5033 TaxID=3446479 RepID=UPI003EDFCC81